MTIARADLTDWTTGNLQRLRVLVRDERDTGS
jgi:hypothetical protein